MRQLIIDTATEALSVALYDDGKLIDHHHEIAGRGHAEKLLPIISALENGGHADEILVDTGPGSFTGVRVGLAAARALAYAWGAGLKGYSTLALLAAMARREYAEITDHIGIVITGGHGELFWQIFDAATLMPHAPPVSTPIDILAHQIDTPVLYGTGAGTLIAARGSGEAILLHPDARHVPFLPNFHFHLDVAPLYGRGADAIPLTMRKG